MGRNKHVIGAVANALLQRRFLSYANVLAIPAVQEVLRLPQKSDVVEDLIAAA